MFIPLHDANGLKHIRLQYVTLGLIAANCLVYLFTAVASQQVTEAAIIGLGYIPSTVFNIAERPPEWALVDDNFTYVTYAFLHGDIWHLGGNMLFLWVFGDNVEDALGHFRFLVFYLLCAIAGAFLHGMIAPDSQAPLIGASGAVAGIVAAYLLLHPRVKIWVLALGRIPLRIPAWIVLALWILFQFGMLALGGACRRHRRRSRARGPHEAARRAAVRPRGGHAARRRDDAGSGPGPGPDRDALAMGPALIQSVWAIWRLRGY
jgi:membrane associated rhomboid family serine protease